MGSEDSRTYLLDRGLVQDLASPDFDLREEAASQLPEALSRAEVNDVAMQVGLVPAPEALRQAEKLEKEVLFYLGSMALIKRADLVTARSAAKELRARGDLAGFVILSWELRKARRNIVTTMLDIGPTGSQTAD